MFVARSGLILGPVAVALAYYLGAMFAMELPLSDDGGATVWPCTGMLIAALLWAGRGYRTQYMIAGCVASLAANLRDGGTLLEGIVYTVANLSEAIVATELIGRWCDDTLDFTNMTHLARFCMIAVGVALGGATIALLAGPGTISAWTSWMLTDSLGMLLLVPVSLLVLDHVGGRRSWRVTRGAAEVATLLALVTIVSLVTFGQSTLPLLFAPMAALSLATYRLGAFGTVAGLGIIVVIGSICTALGLGPINLVGNEITRSLFLQFYIVVCFVATVPMAAKIAAERLLAQRVGASERAHRTMIDRTSDMIFETDVNGRWTFLNPAWRTITGRSVEEGLGTSCLSRTDPGDRARALVEFRRLLAGEIDEASIEIRILSARGTPTWVHVCSRLLHDETGTVTGTYGTARDITDRMTAELALAESERRYRLLAEKATDIIFCLSPAPERTYVSPAVEVVLGIPSSGDSWLRTSDYTHPDDMEQVRGALRRLRRGQSLQEVIVYRANKAGSWIWLEVNARAAPFGDTVEIVGVARDITARKIAQEEALHARQAAEAEAHVARQQADTDDLTGLASRRQFLRQLDRELDAARDLGRPLSVAMFDVDHFKLVNDHYGHGVGDEVLRHVAMAAMAAVRGGDLVGRVGGEEFAVLMPGTDSGHAVAVSERLRAAVGALGGAGRNLPSVTVSAGVCQYRRGMDCAALLAEADRALYAAKFAGRDRLFLVD